ncbi:signal peptide, CUB and EGF-like domain-containing protein 1 [Lingula anatina]|uniref:Signal peptide, CUB and EGF-like domain-containing protein 1 n=1 Tax=Lingula anatina TaxID=7574 RepID=A0A1S3I9D8_LINAN|nr:signal peptide, CUB and EGF-like domain-containing protein 1 [Lingula anatina]|eukprot:XP_013393999.1 signal peptide, CUB and EGF-like domain-containing protein 1 [Lingula anatina]
MKGSLVCGSCPQGQYNANTDSDETCDWCANGVRQGACVACQAGQYQDQYGSSACLPCPSGSYQNESGSAECLPCPPGQFQSETGSQTCIPCAVGEYQNQNGSTSCLPCPVGQFQSSSGQATCSLCQAGHYQDTIGQTTCSSCPAGQYQNSTGQSTCIQCPVGHYQSSVGRAACTACPIGQYQSAAGAVSCVSCSSGSTTAATGSTSASDCVVSDPNCGPGYTLQYAGKNYYFGDPKQGRSQEAAQTCCQNMGMILVAINDAQEWNFVDSNVASTSYNGYWCDAECINSVCIWKNSPNSVFYNPGVGGGAIDGAGNEPCLVMKWAGGIDYQDLACTSTSYNAGFVCE